MLSTAVRISILDIDNRYPVVRAEKLDTKYETSYRTIRESADNGVKNLFPRRYSVFFSEDDMTAINDKNVLYRLTYNGKYFRSNSYILRIDLWS